MISKKPKTSASCDNITVTTTPAVGENGFTTFAQENPFNDVLIEEPALGSGNGILELEDQGTRHVPSQCRSQRVATRRGPLLACARR